MSGRPPFHAEHVGSLLCPPWLSKAQADFEVGIIPEAEFHALANEAVVEAVRMQESIGLQAITDGGYRSECWRTYILYALEAIGQDAASRGGKAEDKSDSGLGASGSTRKLVFEETILGENFWRLNSVIRRGLPKIVVPSPSVTYDRCGLAAINTGAYTDLSEFRADLVHVYRREIAALHTLGCRYLQIEDTRPGPFGVPGWRAETLEAGHGRRRHIRLVSDALIGRPRDMTICLRLSQEKVANGDQQVWDDLFNLLDVDGFFIPIESTHPGAFDFLRSLPKGRKRVILGLVETGIDAEQTRDELMRAVELACRHAPLEQLGLSPQNGFQIAADESCPSWQQQIDRLALVVETARAIWGEA
jgi:5-methyltetrahydropteroyltriglutamate--homocysteine methyltransferase